MFNRAVILVMDSAGVGAMPDAAEYGDVGSDTLGNISRTTGGLNMPVMRSLGLGNLHRIQGVPSVDNPAGLYGRMMEASKGKDTTTGHWEIAGLTSRRPFPTYPHGFPPEVIDQFEKETGTRAIGNYPASGTVIIEELGEQHMKTGYPIVYTSADSVFQIAAHEEIIPISRLYEMCKIARNILRNEHAVGRVIARPFIGQPGNFQRTRNRHDYSVSPPEKTLLDYLQEEGFDVIGVGKISDIFNGSGTTESYPMNDNRHGMEITRDLLKKNNKGLIFTNLIDFDMLYGHRNDPEGYAQALESMDAFLPQILEAMKEDDILFITADHGCDPTTTSTDHSREYVPLIVYSPSLKGGINLGIRNSFADISKTIGEIFGIQDKIQNGESFYSEFKVKSVI
jgi:phosphopentomutase